MTSVRHIEGGLMSQCPTGELMMEMEGKPSLAHGPNVLHAVSQSITAARA